MGLDFGTLLNAALGGTAAYQSGRRIRTDNEEKKAATAAALARQTEIDAENKTYRDAQVSNYQSEAARRQDEIDHPEKYRTPRALSQSEQYSTAYAKYLGEGHKDTEAASMARRAVGMAQETTPELRLGDPGYLDAYGQSVKVRSQMENRYGHHADAGGSGGGGGDDLKTRRGQENYTLKRVGDLVKGTWDTTSGKFVGGVDAETAARQAQSEIQAATNPFLLDVTGGGSSSRSAKSLARSIPAPNARAVAQPARTPTGPRKASDADILNAKAAVGSDPDAIAQYLTQKGLSW